MSVSEFGTDPRPDLIGDAAYWDDLLARAFAFDGDKRNGLYQALHGLRCLGAGLVRVREGVRLIAGAIDKVEYDGYKERWLKPNTDELTRLLREVRG